MNSDLHLQNSPNKDFIIFDSRKIVCSCSKSRRTQEIYDNGETVTLEILNKMNWLSATPKNLRKYHRAGSGTDIRIVFKGCKNWRPQNQDLPVSENSMPSILRIFLILPFKDGILCVHHLWVDPRNYIGQSSFLWICQQIWLRASQKISTRIRQEKAFGTSNNPQYH